jgi:hypothetical protein
MNFHTTQQISYLRPVTNFGVRQQLQPRNIFELPGGLVLWKTSGKMLLCLLPLLIVVNMFLASIINETDRSMMAVDNQRHELIDKNIGLLAQKAGLYAPERVSRLAADKLSLYTAIPGQIERIN